MRIDEDGEGSECNGKSKGMERRTRVRTDEDGEGSECNGKSKRMG